jgi:phage terminase small subunit
MSLTPKQEAFAQHYVKHGNKSDAYRHAYDASKMPDESIWVKANEVSTHVKVSLRIEQLRKELSDKELYTLEESVRGDKKIIDTYEKALDVLQNEDATDKQIDVAKRTIRFIGSHGYSSARDRLAKQHGHFEKDNRQKTLPPRQIIDKSDYKNKVQD